MMRFEFRPENAVQAENYSLMVLCQHVARLYGMTEHEVDKVATADVGIEIQIPDVGYFKRTE